MTQDIGSLLVLVLAIWLKEKCHALWCVAWIRAVSLALDARGEI